MKQVISSENKPIKLWLDEIEDGALQQAKNLANLPFIFKHIALMPDTHQGYGMPIGAVMCTQDVIVPNAVGVDIGCGMCSIKTNVEDIDTPTLKVLLSGIRKLIPLGFSKHREAQDNEYMPNRIGAIVDKNWTNARHQLGTLGGGNHFIEIQKGNDGYIWIMIHSGSRNLGKQVADYYNKVAIRNNQAWFSEVPKKWDLAFLPIHHIDGVNYLEEMQFCVDFALANRGLMMQRILDVFADEFSNFKHDKMINIAHNYARLEHHFNTNVYVHRKGATSCKLDEIGIIPSSQGTKSYIVRGLGNPESFMSCSHGAGRIMGRKQAVKNLDLKTELNKMEGVIHSIRTEKDLDESVGAYKNIDTVMENQNDLVEIVTELTPLAVIKG